MNKYDMQKIFGNNLKKYRLQNGMSLYELSKTVKLEKDFLKNIEEGRANETAFKYTNILGQALNITPNDLCIAD